MLRPHRVSIIASLVFALTACKVEMNSSNADEAKPNADSPAAKAQDAADDASEAAAEADDASATLSAGPAASCGEHKAGDSWKDDCNNCRCTDEGQAVCTRMKCADPE